MPWGEGRVRTQGDLGKTEACDREGVDGGIFTKWGLGKGAGLGWKDREE